VIPEFVIKVSLVAQRGIKLTHDLYDRPGAEVPFIPVFDSAAILDHALYVAAVFWNDKVG
jgi:hypothetical protein